LEKQLEEAKKKQELKDKYEMVRRELEEAEHLAEEVMNCNNSSRVSSYKTINKTSSELVKRWTHANQQSK
jgi:hypothetical protein